MRAIDIFVELIDEKEADRIMKFFQDYPVGTRKTTANLEQKKQHIKKIFKSMTPNMIKKRRKGGADPFYSYLNNYKFSFLSVEGFREQIFLLEEMKDNLSPYVRFANLLLTFPNETREQFDLIQQNLVNGKEALDFGNQIKSAEELKNYLLQCRDFVGKHAPFKIIELLEEYQNDDYKVQLKKCKDLVKEYIQEKITKGQIFHFMETH